MKHRLHTSYSIFLAKEEEMNHVLLFCILHVFVVNVFLLTTVILDICVLQQNMRTVFYDF